MFKPSTRASGKLEKKSTTEVPAVLGTWMKALAPAVIL